MTRHHNFLLILLLTYPRPINNVEYYGKYNSICILFRLKIKIVWVVEKRIGLPQQKVHIAKPEAGGRSPSRGTDTRQ